MSAWYAPVSGEGNCGCAQSDASVAQMKFAISDLCPECGEAAVVNEEKCTGKVRPECYACGYSEC